MLDVFEIQKFVQKIIENLDRRKCECDWLINNNNKNNIQINLIFKKRLQTGNPRSYCAFKKCKVLIN